MAAPYARPEPSSSRAGQPQPNNNATATTQSNSEPLPPDVEDARKARVNREMIDYFRQPAKAGGAVEGIGLYTHVASSASSVPVFLPIGGPERVPNNETRLDSSIDKDVQRVWQELRDAVNEEEKHIGNRDMTSDQLKERYGALAVPDGSGQTAQATQTQTQQQLQIQQAMELLRRHAARNKDVAMGGTNDAGTGADKTSTTDQSALNPAPRGNVYHEARDPRRR